MPLPRGSDNAPQAPRQQIEVRNGVPPLTAPLAALSYCIVFLLYIAAASVMLLAVAHRRRSIRHTQTQSKSPSPCSVFLGATNIHALSDAKTDAKSDVLSMRSLQTFENIPATERGNLLHITDLKAYRLMKIQSRVESDLDDDDNIQEKGTETPHAAVVSALGKSSPLEFQLRCAETCSNADTKMGLPSLLRSTAAEETNDVTVKDLLPTEQVHLTKSVQPSSASSLIPCATRATFSATGSLCRRRRRRNGHSHRKDCGRGCRGCGGETAADASARFAGTALWFLSSSEHSISQPSESSSAMLSDSEEIVTAKLEEAGEKMQASANTKLAPHALAGYVRFCPTRVPQRYLSMVDVGFEYEADAEIDVSDVCSPTASVAVTPRPRLMMETTKAFSMTAVHPHQTNHMYCAASTH